MRFPNRTIGVNLAIFPRHLDALPLQMLQKHPIKNPLRGLGMGGSVFLHRYHPYGIQEGFEVFKVSA